MKQNSLPMAGYQMVQENEEQVIEDYQNSIEDIRDTLKVNGIAFLLENPTGKTDKELLQEIDGIINNPSYDGF